MLKSFMLLVSLALVTSPANAAETLNLPSNVDVTYFLVAGWYGAAIAAGASLIGSQIASNRSGQGQTAYEGFQQSKEFAQQGVQWRVEDAKKAGIHPLYALGANLPTFSPASNVGGEDPLGRSIGIAGQNLGRAVTAHQTKKQRVGSQIYALQIERAGLENDLLRSQIIRSAQTGPPVPSNTSNPMLTDVPGLGLGATEGGTTGKVVVKPMERSSTVPGHGYSEAGVIPDLGWGKTETGYVPIPSKDMKERIEDQIIPEIMWAIRNNLIPTFGQGTSPPWKPKTGYVWWFNAARQEWQETLMAKPSVRLKLN